MTMYYEINNKYNSEKTIKEIIEEKNNKSFSIDEEKEINAEHESSKNVGDL